MLKNLGLYYEIRDDKTTQALTSKMLDASDYRSLSQQLTKPLSVVYRNARVFFSNGVLHNPFDGPCILEQDAHHYREEWNYRSPTGEIVEGRRNGPALVFHQYGKVFRQMWQNYDPNLKPDSVPGYINIEYTGEPNREHTELLEKHRARFRNPGGLTYEDINLRHWDNPKTEKRYSIHDSSVVRQVTPEYETAVIYRREISHSIEHKGLRVSHRNDGPASVVLYNVVERSKNGKTFPLSYELHEQEWYIYGMLVSMTKIKEFCRRSNIVLSEEPCWDRSAFLRPDDQMIMQADLFQRYEPN